MIDLAAMLADPMLDSLDGITDGGDVNLNASLVARVVKAVLDAHVLDRTRKVSRPAPPSLNGDTRKVMEGTDRLFRQFVRHMSAESWEAYRCARNRVKQVVRNLKNKFFRGRIREDAGGVWKVVRAQGGGRRAPLPDPVVPADMLLDSFVRPPLVRMLTRAYRRSNEL
jgi:hypothetical protein